MEMIEERLSFTADSRDIEEIYFFLVNAKYISLNMMKISENSRMHSTSDISDIFNT